mmetsp:Transcript_6095/g.7184  ORF Transcript_6095/g.7184 Transcript_6095/m.7184 type:complete len:95 (-) Transcript_6095:56-340(-)
MALDLAVLSARRMFLVKLAKQVRNAEEGQARDNVKGEMDQAYKLSEEDWAFIGRVCEHRQFSVLKYRHNDAVSESYIGDLTPVLVMHDDKKEEV